MSPSLFNTTAKEMILKHVQKESDQIIDIEDIKLIDYKESSNELKAILRVDLDSFSLFEVIYNRYTNRYSANYYEKTKKIEVKNISDLRTKLIIKARGEGKTTALINMAVNTGAIIIVESAAHVKDIQIQSEIMGVKMPTVYTIQKFLNGSLRGFGKNQHFLIDEGIMVFKTLLSQYGISNVDAIAFSNSL